MKLPQQSLILIAALTQLAGCAILYTFDSNLDKRVDQWIANKQYDIALATLEHIKPSHPHYQLLQKKKQQLLVLKKQQDEAQLAREQHLKTIYYQLYLNKAEWLTKNARLQKELQQVTDEDSSLSSALDEHTGDSVEVYQELLRCGQDMIKQQNLHLAEQCYSAAQRLNPDDKFKPAIISLRQQLEALEKSRSNQLSSRAETLLSDSQLALKKDDVKQANKLFQQIPSQDRQHDDVRQFKRELDKRISTNVAQGIEMGRKLYSQGDVERALAVWNDARQLDPKNEQLTSHIERAQRVLDKLKRLQKNEPVIAPPTSKKDKS